MMKGINIFHYLEMIAFFQGRQTVFEEPEKIRICSFKNLFSQNYIYTVCINCMYTYIVKTC